MKSGLAEYVLVVGAEKLSDIIDPTDRTISFLLADGAGAAIVGPADSAGIGPTVWGSDGSKWDAIGMTSTMVEYREGAGDVAWPTLRQEGQTVFRWAVWEMVKVAKLALERAGVTPDQLAAFVPHQANMRIIDEFAKQLRLPESVVIGRDIATTGNTSAASIPWPPTACSRRTLSSAEGSPCRSASAPDSSSAPRSSCSRSAPPRPTPRPV
nr:hypothetical protein GCM10025699_51540 [Microbacterium flavescens]